MSPLLEIHDLGVERNGRMALRVDHVSVEEGETLAVIGPNGAGKSTLLLTIAGLLQPREGKIVFRGKPVEAWGGLIYRRKIGLVLQNPLLLDGTVFDNVAIGLKFRRLPRGEIVRRVDEWLQRLGLAHLRQRKVDRLSGGEAQRVSLARAFALEPELLLLDEPFSGLDAPTRAHLLEDLQVLLKTTRVTTIFVTHDQDEAMLLGGRIAVILEGSLRQVGTAQEVFSAPSDSEVAAFVGVETVISGQITESREGRLVVQANGIQLEAVGDVAVGRQIFLCLRPEDITLWPRDSQADASSARNRLNGRVQRLIWQGALVRVVVDCGFPLVALVTRASANEMGLVEGMEVRAAFKASAVHLIAR